MKNFASDLPDHFAALGVEPDALLRDIDVAFGNKDKDRCSIEEWRACLEAYNVLAFPDRSAAYQSILVKRGFMTRTGRLLRFLAVPR